MPGTSWRRFPDVPTLTQIRSELYQRRTLHVFFIPSACARWCPMPQWQLVAIANSPAPWCWEYTSTRHHSLMSSIHSLLDLPLLFCLSMIPDTAFFTTFLTSSQYYRRARIIFASSPRSFAPHTFWCQAFVFSLNSLFSAASVCGEFFSSSIFKIPSGINESMSLFLSVQVSHAYRSTLITYDIIMPSFFPCADVHAAPYSLEPGYRSSYTWIRDSLTEVVTSSE